MEAGMRSRSQPIDGPLEEIETEGQRQLKALLHKQLDTDVSIPQYEQKKSRLSNPEYHGARLKEIDEKISKKKQLLDQADTFASVKPISRHLRKNKTNRHAYKADCTLECCRPVQSTCEKCEKIRNENCVFGDSSHERDVGICSHMQAFATCMEKPDSYVSVPEPLETEKPKVKVHTKSSSYVVKFNTSDACKLSQSGSDSNTKREDTFREIEQVEQVPEHVIRKYKLSDDEVKNIPRFQNYSPGEPNNVLFVKNLSPRATEEDLASLFVGFQTQPCNTETATKALDLVHGYMFKEKPVIIHRKVSTSLKISSLSSAGRQSSHEEVSSRAYVYSLEIIDGFPFKDIHNPLTPHRSAASSSSDRPSSFACSTHLSYDFCNHDNPASPTLSLPSIRSFFPSGFSSGKPVPPSFQVMTQVSCQVVEPKQARPADGILFINVELSPMACPSFEPGRLSDFGVEINRLLERCLKESRCIDTESLCIVAGEKVWELRADVHVLNHDGNLVDACSIAAIAALAHFRRPDVTVSGDEITIHPASERDPVPLSVHHMPICVSFAFFEQGKFLLVDPVDREEKVMDGRMVIGMNKHREICTLQITGQMLLLKDQVLRCSNIAVVKVAEITDLIHKALDNDRQERAKGGKFGFAETISLDSVTTNQKPAEPIDISTIEGQKAQAYLVGSDTGGDLGDSSEEEDVVQDDRRPLEEEEKEIAKKFGTSNADLQVDNHTPLLPGQAPDLGVALKVFFKGEGGPEGIHLGTEPHWVKTCELAGM
ncbi:EXOS9-like protein, partial [Mya arenaria]